MVPLDLELVGQEFARLEERFDEGDEGLLELQLDRRLSPNEVAYLERELDGKAFHILSPLTQDDDGVLSIQFQVGIIFLPLIVLALGALPIGLLAWKLSNVSAEQWMRTLKGIIIPLGAVVVGGGFMIFGGGKWPSLMAGGLAMAGGGYLAYRELGPPAPPPPPVPAAKMKALTEYEGVSQPEMSVYSSKEA